MDFKDFLLRESTTKDTIDFKTIYVDIAGDLISGLLLSQIIYWHLPGKNNLSKLRVVKEGKKWLAKRHEDRRDEIRITKEQSKRAIGILKKVGVIQTKVFKFNGNPTVHIRLEPETLMEKLKVVLTILENGSDHFPELSEPLSLTENTSKITTENNLEPSEESDEIFPEQDSKLHNTGTGDVTVESPTPSSALPLPQNPKASEKEFRLMSVYERLKEHNEIKLNPNKSISQTISTMFGDKYPKSIDKIHSIIEIVDDLNYISGVELDTSVDHIKRVDQMLGVYELDELYDKFSERGDDWRVHFFKENM